MMTCKQRQSLRQSSVITVFTQETLPSSEQTHSPLTQTQTEPPRVLWMTPKLHHRQLKESHNDTLYVCYLSILMPMAMTMSPLSQQDTHRYNSDR